MRPVVPSLALALVLLGSSLPFATGVSATQGTVTGFAYYGWQPKTFPWGLGAVSGPGTVTGSMDATHRSLFVEAVGSDGDYWNLDVTLDGSIAPIVPGTYTTGPLVWLSVSHAGETGCSVLDRVGSITIFDFQVDASGTVTSLAADFTYKCPGYNPPPVLANGQVRINSAQPLTAIDIEPQHDPFPFIDRDFGVVPVGTTSSPWVVTVTNRGTTAVDVGGSMAGDTAFALQPSGCAGPLAPGATCQLSVTFSPAVGGPTSGELHVSTPSLGITDRPFSLAATGFQETTTTLVVDPLDEGPTPGAAAYHISVSPAPAQGSGTYELTRTCGSGNEAGVGVTSWLWSAAGPCTATATFHGYAGFGTSSSGPVSFTMPAKSKVVLTSDYGGAVESDPMELTATVSAANGPEPSAGTITISDETTGIQLASGPISAGTKSVSGVADLAAGDHVIRADYTGDAVVLGSTGTRPVTIADDSYPPDGFLVVPEFTVTPTITAQTPAMDLPIDIVTDVALSNDGVHWATYPYAPTVEWSLIDPATGGSNVDGHHVVYAKWRDRPGNWSPVQTKDTVLDRGAPVGSATINAGAAYASSSSVSLSIPATDNASGVSIVRISNDGVTWTTKAYAPSIVWNLPAANGTRSVSVRWRDKAGNWSAARTDSIVLDTTGPSLSPLSLTLMKGSAASGHVPIATSWSGTDAVSGIARYVLARRVDGGALTTVNGFITASAWTQVVAPSHRYRFEVRGVDRAGNLGPSAAWREVSLVDTPDDSARVTYAGAWSRPSGAGYGAGSAHVTKAAGASATFGFTGRSVGWLASVGPSLGKVAVYVDGKKETVVDLYRPTAAAREVVFTREWSSFGQHTIRLVNEATSGRATAIVDGFYSLDGRVIGVAVVTR